MISRWVNTRKDMEMDTKQDGLPSKLSKRKTQTKSQLPILNPVKLSDVLDYPYVTKIAGVDLTQDERTNLKIEANQFKQTRLWSILTNTIKQLAQQTMFQNAKNWDDMVAGKTMLYNIEVMEKTVETLSNIQIN